MLFFKKIIKKRKRTAMRNRMRGYRMLKDSDQLDLLIRIKDEITNTPIKGFDRPSKLFFGAGIEDSSKIIRQILIFRFVGFPFNKTILEAIGKRRKKVTTPLPPEWRSVLESYGFETNTIWNSIVWFAHVILFYFYGVFVGLQIIADSIKNRNDFRNKGDSQISVYFQNLTKNNLPQYNPDGKSYDIVTWYSQWNRKLFGITAFCHSVKNVSESKLGNVPVIYVNSAITPLKGVTQFFKFISFFLTITLVAIFDLFKGRYWSALMLNESCKSLQIRILDCSQLSTEYLFHNSGYLLRPLWTYDAEEKGSKIWFYFYSANIERFKEPQGYQIQPFSWQIITWSNFMVWDDYQADFVKRAVGEGKIIEIVGPIDFHDSSMECQILPKKSILVFDVQPHRDLLYQMHVVVPEYFVPEIVNKFLEDIYFVAQQYQYYLILKRKRHIGNILNKRYKSLVDKLAKSEFFISIDPDIAAIRLIKQSDIVISLPFTATAITAKKEGKISIFYDPSGIVQKDDRAAHGIEVVSGLDELIQWFEKINKLS